MTWSRQQFGREAQLRYERLLNTAMRELAADPGRPGVREAGRRGLWLYHLRHARQRPSPADRVGQPRHILVFIVMADELRIVRVLHDAMDLPLHLEDI